MITQSFFKLFPPPKFLNIPHAGLDICDDAVRCIEYSHGARGITIHRYGTKMLPPGVVESGHIKDEHLLEQTVRELAHELKISIVKASLPEERMYLFKTEVPDAYEEEIRQNIEFKLEENVPVSAADSVFFFDLIPLNAVSAEMKDKKIASVSVAPHDLISSYLGVLQRAGLTVLSFEIQAKAIARAIVPRDSIETQIIVYIMGNKTGIYIVCGGVVCFTSTISWGYSTIAQSADVPATAGELKTEIQRVYGYWVDHGGGTDISRVILAGRGALFEGLASHCSPDPRIPVEVAQVWQNAFSSDRYIPQIPYEDSLDYAIAAGLALPS